jgi:hypothetical protein
MLGDLPARLSELVPPSRMILARTAVTAYQAVPWRVDLAETGPARASESDYSATEAEIGSRIVSGFLPYSLIYRTLAGLLGESARDAAESRPLLEHCANFMLTIMTEDIGLKEALEIFLAEDIDPEIASRLARDTRLGGCPAFLDAVGIDAVEKTDADSGSGGTPVPPATFLRFSDSWDAPACFLDMVPEAAGRFSHLFAEAVRRTGRNPGTAGEPFDLINAAVGRPISEMARPERLIGEVVTEVIDEMFRSGEVSDDLVNGCCQFMAVAIAADESEDGHLARVVQEKLSVEFAWIAVRAYHGEGELTSILRRVVDRP